MYVSHQILLGFVAGSASIYLVEPYYQFLRSHYYLPLKIFNDFRKRSAGKPMESQEIYDLFRNMRQGVPEFKRRYKFKYRHYYDWYKHPVYELDIYEESRKKNLVKYRDQPELKPQSATYKY
mmetsp:Transcript_37836/g.42873  ORF Transcript_37836/g.42873 Transcript_37836/m.42873 type:complete len:122 (-) Transcript_37836:1295-1660(-)